MSAPPQRYDVAIAGGGIAGCYCAYRLAQAYPRARIALFESTARLGGRLESKFLPGIDTPAELGGAFLSDMHENTFGLARALGLALTPVSWSRGSSFVRGEHFTDRAYRDEPDAIPYAFSANERGQAPADILRAALRTIVPEIASLWPLDREASPASAATHLQQLRFNERVLDDWDFGALLREVVSDEAYRSFLTAFGSSANFGAASAYDAIRTLMGEMAPQQPFVLAAGLEQLPLELARRSGADVHTSTRVVSVGGEDGHVKLIVQHVGGEEIIAAKHAILALPMHALQQIELDVPPEQALAFKAELAKVIPVSACKLFLSFEQPWWRAVQTATSGFGIAASYTDLPMQQCYYFDRQGEGPALLLAVFADGDSAAFWTPLCANDDAGAASRPMIDAALNQLRAMHPDADIPEPVAAVARAWPAAWHAWKPGAQSWRSAKAMRGPHFGLPLYVCGEAYSTQQGWVEGAIASAEMMLQKQFGLDLPPWVEAKYNLHL